MDNLKEVLNKVGLDIVNELKELSKKDDFIASGDLNKSFSYEIKENTVIIYGAKYTRALSDGISKSGGSSTQFNNKLIGIRRWARYKRLQPRDKKGRFISNSIRNFNQMTFNMAVSIGKKGISKRFGYKGSGFFEEMKKNVISNVTNTIAEAYKMDIIVEIN